MDVLAVMGAAIPCRCDCGYEHCSINAAIASLTEARAAVTETADDLRAFISDYKHGLGPDIARLDQALERIAP